MTKQSLRPAIVLSLTLAWGASGCGGNAASDDATTTSDDSTTGSEDTTAPAQEPIAWTDMDAEQRMAFMQESVVPQMQELFQGFDAERYAEFNCATCHGDNAQEVGFEMPNGLAPLNPEQIPAMFQSEQPMAQFMTQQVWPQMHQILGLEPYNPETNQGFGCLNCHATQGAE